MGVKNYLTACQISLESKWHFLRHLCTDRQNKTESLTSTLLRIMTLHTLLAYDAQLKRCLPRIVRVLVWLWLSSHWSRVLVA